MGWFSDIIGKVKNAVGGFISDPIGKLRSIGSDVLHFLGKAKGITGEVKKVKDFVSKVPVIGDAVQSSVGGIIDQVDSRVNQADSIANSLNNRIQ